MRIYQLYRSLIVLIVAAIMLGSIGCTSSSTKSSTANQLSLTLGSTALSVAPDGTSSTLAFVVSRSSGDLNPIQVTASGLPAGATVAFVQPIYGTYGSVILTTTVGMTPGLYPIVLTASDGTVSSSSTLQYTVQAVDAVAITPALNALIARQDGTVVSTNFTVTHAFGNSNAITVSAKGMPSGMTATFTQPGTGTSGSVQFQAAANTTVAGTYSVTLTATDGTASGATVVSVTVAILATVSSTQNTAQGVAGAFQEFMSTGFQPSTYNNKFFVSFPSTVALTALGSEHIRLQPVDTTMPWVANSSPAASTDWSFTALDQTVQPVLATGDNSPIFQIAQAPAFLCDASGNFIDNAANLQLFAAYAQNLVRYYNTGGFDWGGKHYASSSAHHITWWAIFNEPNLHKITAAQYVAIYNTIVPAMLSVDPTLKFAALELSDYAGQPQFYMPQLVQPSASGGLSAQVNAVTTHFYGSCNQTTTDAVTFTKVAQFVSDVNYIRSELATRSDLASIPVWVTENNVNSDYQTSTGYSTCNPTQIFQSDARGTSAYFTAWRPYVFSQLGKAGNQGLYHFLYEGSNQYGEVINTSDAETLAYWTDYWLEHSFPWNGSATGGALLTTTTTEPTATIEILAVHNADKSVSLMVSNIAVASSSDNNGNGAPRTVYVDISSLGAFSSATQVSLNAATSTSAGPAVTTVTPGTTLTVSFTGYGTSFYQLKP